MKNVKFNSNYIIKNVAIFFACLVFANAQVVGLSPFLYAFFFACLFVGFNEKLLSVFVLSSAVVVNLSLQTFFIALACVATGLIIYYIFRLIKKRMGIWWVFGSFLISQSVYGYYNYQNIKHLIFYILLGLVCLFVFIVVMQVLLLRKNCFKLTLDESICFMFAIAVLGAGLAPIEVLGFSVFNFAVMLIIYLCISIGSPVLTMSVVLAFTFGSALTSFSLNCVAGFIIIAMLGSVFRFPHRFKIVLTCLLADVLLKICFFASVLSVVNFLPLIFASIVFICMPKKSLIALSDVVYIKKNEISTRNLINTTRKSLRKRMSELSNVFMDMKQIHLSMLKKQLNKEELIAMLTRELTNTCCKDCLDKNRCTRALGTSNKSNLEYLIDLAIIKGKVSLLDLPNGLTDRCGKINALISTLNRLCEEYRQYKHMMSDINNVKILLADQMGAVSRLMLDIGDEIDTNVSFDVARENKIISKLLSKNIECKEVLLYTEKQQDISAVCVVKAQAELAPVVEKVISEVLKCPMQICNIMPVENGDFNSLTLRRESKFDCVFGLASCNKAGNELCGDCHSIIRLGGDKFLLALCDGMGSGVGAHKMSAMTLGLIENFYKVGFNNDIILESVNKLLAISNQENYSTLDICLLDLNKQLADFIKVGSPFGFIKRENNLELVEGGALPIGALDSINPSTHKTTISTKDIVIMATDGITDAFETVENMAEFVDKLASNNPQTLAETILNEALSRNKMSAKDDMTVLVARTYLKS